jgi:carboxypeptidase family protein
MAKLHSIQINIPHPCSQNWDEMTVNGIGRHCEHCTKTVIDFTTWSDTALYNFFAKNSAGVCGRFLSAQTDRYINIPYQPHSRLYRIAVALGLTLIFTQTPDLLAQSRPPKTEQTSILKQIDSTGNEGGGITGRIFDDKKEPLPSAVVEVFQNGVLKGGKVTDFDGNYKIKSLEPGLYDIVVLYAGYDSILLNGFVVSPNSTSSQNFQLQRRNGLDNKTIKCIMGYISLGEPLDLDNPTKTTFTREEISQMPR